MRHQLRLGPRLEIACPAEAEANVPVARGGELPCGRGDAAGWKWQGRVEEVEDATRASEPRDVSIQLYSSSRGGASSSRARSPSRWPRWWFAVFRRCRCVPRTSYRTGRSRSRDCGSDFRFLLRSLLLNELGLLSPMFLRLLVEAAKEFIPALTAHDFAREKVILRFAST